MRRCADRLGRFCQHGAVCKVISTGKRVAQGSREEATLYQPYQPSY